MLPGLSLKKQETNHTLGQTLISITKPAKLLLIAENTASKIRAGGVQASTKSFNRTKSVRERISESYEVRWEKVGD